MVRILLSSCFFLSSFAFAHNSGSYTGVPELYCEHKLNSLNYAQVEAYKFLKKLQIEADQEFPAEEFTRLTVGRAIAPLAAALKDVPNVPLEMNFYKYLHGEEKENLYRVLKNYIQTDLTGKKIVVMLYSEKVSPVILFSRMFLNYLQEKKIAPRSVEFRVYTSQMVVREMQAGLTDNMYSFRPIGAANQVRHWFHDGLKPTPFNYSQFPIVDVHGRAIVDKVSPEREAFTTLKQEISELK